MRHDIHSQCLVISQAVFVAHLGHCCLEQLLKDKQRHFAALGHSRIVHLQAIVPVKSLLFSFLCFSSTKPKKQTPFSTSMTMKRLPESFKCCCRRSERFTGALNNLLFHNRRPLKDVATTVLSCFQSSVQSPAGSGWVYSCGKLSITDGISPTDKTQVRDFT